jgi:hypothetical protein
VVLLKFQVFWDVTCCRVKVYNISEDCNIFIFSALSDPNNEGSVILSKCWNYLPMTMHNIPEDLSLPEHRTFYCPKAQYCNFEENACSHSL